MSKSQILHGVHAALFTPLNRDDAQNLRNTIDYSKAKQMIDDLIAQGVQGIVPVGTTGQSATLSSRQHLDMIKFTLDYVDGRCAVVAGAGSNCTRESVDMISEIQNIAKVPVLCVTGYYNNPTQDGILRHFQTLVSETGADIVLYNVPGRTNNYMSAEVIIELAKDKLVIGLKQAVNFKDAGDHRQDTLRIIAETKSLDFAVLSGEDDSLSQILKDGGVGLISATANIPEASQLFLQIVDAATKGDWSAADLAQEQVLDFVRATFCRKNPIPLGTFFNSPLYQPLSSVIDTLDGESAVAEIQKLIESRAPSLLKYR